MGKLSNVSQAYITADADAVAADIALGKIAYGPNGKVTGTGNVLAGGSMVLYWDFMTLSNGVLSGTETPQYMADGISIVALSNLTKSADGVSANTTSNGALRFLGLPTQTGRRRYIVALDQDEINAPANTRLDVRWNYADSINYWQYEIIDQTSDWVGLLYERTANVLTERDRTTWSAAIEDCTNLVCIEDYGDEVQISETVAEKGTGNIERGIFANTWYAASRPNKTATGLELRWVGHDASDLIRVQSIMVQDF